MAASPSRPTLLPEKLSVAGAGATHADEERTAHSAMQDPVGPAFVMVTRLWRASVAESSAR